MLLKVNLREGFRIQCVWYTLVWIYTNLYSHYAFVYHTKLFGSCISEVNNPSFFIWSPVNNCYYDLFVVCQVSHKKLCAERMCAVCTNKRVVMQENAATCLCSCRSFGVVRGFASLLCVST